MKTWVGAAGIFIVTFFLIFIFFTMVEMSMICSEERVNIMVPQCQVIPDKGADFVLGVVLVVVLGLVDMYLVYSILSDFLLRGV